MNMSTDKRQFTLRLNEQTFDNIKRIADKNKRSITMQIEFILDKYIEEHHPEKE